MYQSKLFTPTLKEAPSEAQIPSHILMLRAGLVRQLEQEFSHSYHWDIVL